MIDQNDSQILQPHFRQLRAKSSAWAVALLIFAGPLNPAAWIAILWIFIDDLAAFAVTILVPCIFMSAVITANIRRARFFHFSKIWKYAFAGFIPTYIIGPLSFSVAFGGFSLDNLASLINILFFGTMFLVIPSFFVVIGVPCFIAAAIVAFVCTTKVRPVGIPPDTPLPKSAKPV